MGIVCPRARASSFFLKGHKDPDLSSASPLAFCSLSDTLVYHTHSRLWVLCQTRSTLQVHSLACHSLPSLPRYKRRPTPRESLIYSPPLGKRSYFNSKYRSSGSRNLAVPFSDLIVVYQLLWSIPYKSTTQNPPQHHQNERPSAPRERRRASGFLHLLQLPALLLWRHALVLATTGQERRRPAPATRRL